MSIHFDLLREPWIPAADPQGVVRYLGLLDLLEQSPELAGISDPSPLVEYGLYRLLCVFLMDALRPEDPFEIQDILLEGSFDMAQIHRYVERCQAEGASFDLFDEKRPFLQTPYDPRWDKEKKPVACLDCTIPTGNNHIHFNHLQTERILDYGEAARLLPLCALFVTAGAQGYPSGINAAPPYFVIIKGKNLFGTLVNLLLPVEEIPDFDSSPAFWRCTDTVEPKRKVGKTSWLYGMLFPARRVLLIPRPQGVKEVYYSQGMNFCESSNWTDPHVTYRVGKDGRFPWRPNGERAVWRNLNDLIDVSGKHAPKSIDLYERLHGNAAAYAHLCLYGVQTSQASYLNLFYHDLDIPMALLKCGRSELVGKCIGEAENLARWLKGALSCPGIPEDAVWEGVQTCYQACETALWGLCRRDLAMETIDPEGVLRKWKLCLSQIGRQVMNQALNKVSLSGREWLEVYKQQQSLERYLLGLKKEGSGE